MMEYVLQLDRVAHTGPIYTDTCSERFKYLSYLLILPFGKVEWTGWSLRGRLSRCSTNVSRRRDRRHLKVNFILCQDTAYQGGASEEINILLDQEDTLH
jgi:hypothetical protein